MKLDNNISIFVPSTFDGNKPAKRMQRRETKRTARYLSTYFGGCTQTSATGYYISSSRGLIEERQNICQSFCTVDDLASNRAKIFAYAKRLCRRMKQESITVQINNELYFVEQ